jgi:hypothetical protein
VNGWKIYGRITAPLQYNFTETGKLHILPHPAISYQTMENVSQNLPLQMMLLMGIMIYTNTNFLPLQLYLNYWPKITCNTVYDKQSPLKPAIASLIININNCSISITSSWQGNQMCR